MATEDPVIFVNVLEVDPSQQQELVQLLKEGTEEVMRHRPGFISVTLLASKDGTRVVNYAQWRSAEDIKATQSDPAAQEYAKRTGAIAKPGPNVYSMVADYRS